MIRMLIKKYLALYSTLFRNCSRVHLAIVHNGLHSTMLQLRCHIMKTFIATLTKPILFVPSAPFYEECSVGSIVCMMVVVPEPLRGRRIVF